MWEVHPGSTRLERFGYSYEHRPYQEWALDPSGMPDVLFTTEGQIGFIREVEKFPARGEMMMKESGFDFSSFRTPEQLGYKLAARIVPASTPWWFPTSWMPKPDRLINQHTLLVYVRSPEWSDSTSRHKDKEETDVGTSNPGGRQGGQPLTESNTPAAAGRNNDSVPISTVVVTTLGEVAMSNPPQRRRVARTHSEPRLGSRASG